tara:strand:+ start:417 stop:533 length:117 start_codon:yes stop_codon:yes gene_type:complete
MNEYDEQDEMTKRLLDMVCKDVNVPTDVEDEETKQLQD